MQHNLTIRETAAADHASIVRIQRAAFGQPAEAELTLALLDDPTAVPQLSLLAVDGDAPIGHVLFTRVRIEGHDVLAQILAPVAVLPEHQRRGVGGQLIREGLRILRERDTTLVFVLGHPEYYPKFGFVPDATAQGFAPPYPIAEEHRNAWMAIKLREDDVSGRAICADALMRPEMWRE